MEIGKSAEHIKLREEFNKETKSIALLNKMKYMLWLENRLAKKSTLQGVMPRSLTAENGAKDLLSGEFAECFDPDGSGNPYVVPISWDSIKKIYKRIVDHYVA